MFSETGLIGQACAVSVNAFREWHEEQDHFVLDDPYYFCLDAVLKKLIRGIRETEDKGIVIYCDREENHEQLGEKIASWHTQKLRAGGDVAFGSDTQRPVTVSYVSNFHFHGLQGADILAHGIYQRCCYHLAGNAMRAQGHWDDVSPLLSAVEPVSHFGVTYLDSKQEIARTRDLRIR